MMNDASKLKFVIFLKLLISIFNFLAFRSYGGEGVMAFIRRQSVYAIFCSKTKIDKFFFIYHMIQALIITL